MPHRRDEASAHLTVFERYVRSCAILCLVQTAFDEAERAGLEQEMRVLREPVEQMRLRTVTLQSGVFEALYRTDTDETARYAETLAPEDALSRSKGENP